MAKSLRSKIKRRYRRAKRHLIENTVHLKRANACHETIVKSAKSHFISKGSPKNAFLHPHDVEAVIPRRVIERKVDFRSPNLPLSGYAVTGNRRAFSTSEKLQLNFILKSSDSAAGQDKIAYEIDQFVNDTSKNDLIRGIEHKMTLTDLFEMQNMNNPCDQVPHFNSNNLVVKNHLKQNRGQRLEKNQIF